MDKLGFISGVSLLLIYAFDVVAPYVFKSPQGDVVRGIEQMQDTTQNLLLILFGFLFGNSVGKRQQEQTIATLAETAQTAGAQGSITTTTTTPIPPTGE